MQTLNTTIDVRIIPGIISWDNPEELNTVFAVKEAYIGMAYEELNKMLDRVSTEAEGVSDVRYCLNRLSEEELKRFLYIPEISNKIFRRKNMTDAQKVQFIQRALHTELAKEEESFDVERYQTLWAADGSVMMQYNAEEKEFACFCADTLHKNVIMDFFSPFNRMQTDMNCPIPKEFTVTTYDYDESLFMYKKVTDSIINADPYVKDYIDALIHVILMKKFEHPDPRCTLSTTSSNGAFVGRVILGNVASYTSEDLIDALVHEATHSLLYMIDDINQWMPTPVESSKIGNIIKSPWTGNMLTVRTILQAVFVWYALYKFWDKHRDAYNPEYVKERLNYLREGFRNLKIEKSQHVTEPTYSVVQQVRAEVLA